MLRDRGTLPLTDSSMVSTVEAFKQDGAISITSQSTAEDHEVLELVATASLQLSVGRVVLVAIDLHFHCNLPRLHSIEWMGFSNDGVLVISQPVIWILSKGLSEFSNHQSIRVWVEILVNYFMPTLNYRVRLLLEPRDYDEARQLDATFTVDASGYVLKWMAGGAG